MKLNISKISDKVASAGSDIVDFKDDEEEQGA